MTVSNSNNINKTTHLIPKMSTINDTACLFFCNFLFLPTVQYIYTTKHYTHFVDIFPILIYIFMYWINTYITSYCGMEWNGMIIAPDDFLFWWSYFPLFSGNRNIHFLIFLARLAKGNVSFCHHLASVVR